MSISGETSPGPQRGGTTLDDADTGTVLAGRYRLEHRVRSQTHGSLWRARDSILDREVSVRLVTIGSEHADAVTDAARRASLGGDARLQRVLDVGSDGGYVFVVCENVDGLDLAAMTSEHPLGHDATRRVIGEAAEALESASGRGIHHLRLTPSSLMVRPDGDVKVLGVAMEAAMAGKTAPDAESADRSDAVGLVALLYAGLTGRWPMGDAGFAPAPWVDGSPAAPSSLVPGIPPELDDLCLQTLGDHAGPRTAAEVAEILRPWEAQRPLADLLGGEDGSRTATGPLATAVLGTVSETDGTRRIDLDAAGSSDADRETITPVAGIRTAEIGRPPVPRPTAKPSVKVPRPAKDAKEVPRPTAKVPKRRPPSPGRHNPTTGALPLPRAWEEITGPQRVIPPSPYPLAMPTETPSRSQSRLVIALFAVVLVLGLLLAFSSLRGWSAGGLFGTDPTFTPDASSTSSSSSAAPAPSATISDVKALDPLGDNSENDAKTKFAFDEDSSTSWTSNQYKSAEFGNLKSGVGLDVDLGKSSSVSQVTLKMVGSGGKVELRTSSDGQYDGSKVVASAEITGTTVVLKPASPVTTEHLVVWFTELGKNTQGGGYVADVAEISVP